MEQEKIFDVKKHLEAGEYLATIEDVVYRKTGEFEYIDIVFLVREGDGYFIKAGYPANISTATLLGNLLVQAGIDLAKKKHVSMNEIRKCLKGRDVRVVVTIDEDGFYKIERECVFFVDK